jgi:hypothetical protein
MLRCVVWIAGGESTQTSFGSTTFNGGGARIVRSYPCFYDLIGGYNELMIFQPSG